VPGALNGQRLAAAGAALSLNAAGEPAVLTLSLNGAPATVAYRDLLAAGDTLYAVSVTTRARGATLTLQLTSAAQTAFAAADFPVPPLHAPATRGYGGGQ
jgi:hypothetical protein